MEEKKNQKKQSKNLLGHFTTPLVNLIAYQQERLQHLSKNTNCQSAEYMATWQCMITYLMTS